jgi:hypothetical protein
MPELASILDRKSRTVDLSPGHFERLLRRRDRRRRNRRIGAALLAIVVAGATLGYVADVFRRGAEPVPLDRITGANVDHLRLTWSVASFKAAAGMDTARDGVVYGDAGGGPNGYLAGYRLDCVPTDGTCDPVWSSEPIVDSGHAPIVLGKHALYSGGGTRPGLEGSITAFPLGCDAQPCEPEWTSTPLGGADPAVPIREIGDRVYAFSSRLDRIAAFGLSCDRSVCPPIWTSSGVGAPVVRGRRVVALTTDGVAAFETACWKERGPACPALWTAQLAKIARDDDGMLPIPVVTGSHVVVNDGQTVEVFALSCTGRCSPEWTAEVPGGPGFQPVVADGTLLTAARCGADLLAYSLDCRHDGGTCPPVWVGHTEDGVGFRPVVEDDHVLVATTLGASLTAFPITCEGSCSASWTAQLDDSIVYPPTVSNGLIYVSGIDGITVFPEACGDPCGAVFRWNVPGGSPQGAASVTDDTVLIIGNGSLHALRLERTGEDTRADASWPDAGVPVAALALLGIATVAVRRRGRSAFSRRVSPSPKS